MAVGGRLIVVARDELLLAKLDRMLWDLEASSFLPHAVAGGPDDARQPVLLSTGSDAPNLARNFLIADGIWRDAALNYDRSFYLFDELTVTGRAVGLERPCRERRSGAALLGSGRRQMEAAGVRLAPKRQRR